MYTGYASFLCSISALEEVPKKMLIRNGNADEKQIQMKGTGMKRLDYLSEITGYEKIIKTCGNKEAERLNKEIRYYEHLPQKRFEAAYSSGTIPRIYAVYCGMYTVEEYLGIL